MKQKNKQSLKRSVLKIGYGIDYPLDAAMDVPSVRIIDRSIAVIEGCKGLVDYRQDRVTMDLGEHTVTFYGSDLVLETLCKGSMNITGIISSAAFDIKENG